MDLIAVPWVEDAADPQVLKDALLSHVGACGYADLLRRDDRPEEDVRALLRVEERAGRCADEAEIKPHGRLAWNLYLYEGTKIDLSILPRNLCPKTRTSN